MASRIMHLAITEKICESFPVKDKNRLRLGSILPDAYAGGIRDTSTHLTNRICGGTKNTHDLCRYKELFGERMKKDDLYLGYYLHLIQDLVYRQFVYGEKQWDSTVLGNVERLHKDYHQLNSYVIGKYHLQDDLVAPVDFGNEEINRLHPFDLDSFLEEMKEDYRDQSEGEYFFLTEEMADEYIKRVCDICIKELEALSKGEAYMDEFEWAWDRKITSLLETTLNTRELGGYQTAEDLITKCQMLIRSDMPKAPSERDISFLRNQGVTTIIDMRGKREVSASPSSFAELAGFTYFNIPIEEGSNVPKSTEAVPHSYMDIAEAANMPNVFRQIAHAEGGVLFHCSAGKDRTGVVSAILLSLFHVGRKDIVQNYMLTKPLNAERFRLIPQKHPDIDINIVIPHEEYILRFLQMFEEKYKTAEEYLLRIGLTQEEIERIKQKGV